MQMIYNSELETQKLKFAIFSGSFESFGTGDIHYTRKLRCIFDQCVVAKAVVP